MDSFGFDRVDYDKLIRRMRILWICHVAHLIGYDITIDSIIEFLIKLVMLCQKIFD